MRGAMSAMFRYASAKFWGSESGFFFALPTSISESTSEFAGTSLTSLLSLTDEFKEVSILKTFWRVLLLCAESHSTANGSILLKRRI